MKSCERLKLLIDRISNRAYDNKISEVDSAEARTRRGGKQRSKTAQARQGRRGKDKTEARQDSKSKTATGGIETDVMK